MAVVKLHIPREGTVPRLVGQCRFYPTPVPAGQVCGGRTKTARSLPECPSARHNPRANKHLRSALGRARTSHIPDGETRFIGLEEGSGAPARVFPESLTMAGAVKVKCGRPRPSGASSIRGLGCLLLKRRRPPRGAASRVPV